MFWSPIIPLKPLNCPHQIDPFPARSNPHNARLGAINPNSAVSMTKCKSRFVTEQNPVPVCTPPGEMSSRPLQACDVSSLYGLYKGDAHGRDCYFSANSHPSIINPLYSTSSRQCPLIMPRHQKVAGYYVIPSEILSVRPSVRLSVCLSVRPSVRPSVRQRPPPFLYRQLLLQF